MDTTPITKPKQPFRSYREYLHYLAGVAPEYEWLKRFFDVESTDRSETSFLFLEIADHRMRRIFDPGPVRLKTPPSDVTTRIFMLTHSSEPNIDREILDTVSFALDLDPKMLWHYFDHDYSHLDEPGPDKNKLFRDLPTLTQLSSTFEHLYIQFDQYGSERLMAAVVKSPEPSQYTNVVIICDSPVGQPQAHSLLGRVSMSNCPSASVPNRQLTDLYHFVISSWSQHSVTIAEHEPVRFILPCVRFLQQKACKKMDESSYKAEDMTDVNLIEFWSDELMDEQEQIFDLQTVSRRTTMSLNNFRKFLQLHNGEDVMEAKHIIYDFESLLDSAQSLRDALKDHVTRRTALISIEESRKSIQMADSVKSLTQIAFVFVPMTFASSLFGANVREMGSGTVPLWAFTTTILLISLIAMLGWGLYTGVVSSTVAVHWRHIRCLLLFSMRTPYHAAMLFLCLMFETSEVWENQLHYLALSRVLLDGKPNVTAYMNVFRLSHPGDSRWQAFKRARFYDAALFTSQENWQHNMFHRRLFSCVSRALNKINNLKKQEQKQSRSESSTV